MPSFLSSPWTQALSGLIAVGYTIKALVFVYAQITTFVRRTQPFSIAGIWTANFESSIPGKHVVEIFKITQYRENISLYLQHYNNIKDTFRKYRGIGKFRGNSISLVYYDKSGDTPINGVFSLVIERDASGKTLVGGRFAELGRVGTADYVAKK
jgi:hypothetical protein